MINDLVKRDRKMNFNKIWGIRLPSTRQGGGLRICELIKFVIVSVDGLLIRILL